MGKARLDIIIGSLLLHVLLAMQALSLVWTYRISLAPVGWLAICLILSKLPPDVDMQLVSADECISSTLFHLLIRLPRYHRAVLTCCHIVGRDLRIIADLVSAIARIVGAPDRPTVANLRIGTVSIGVYYDHRPSHPGKNFQCQDGQTMLSLCSYIRVDNLGMRSPPPTKAWPLWGTP